MDKRKHCKNKYIEEYNNDLIKDLLYLGVSIFLIVGVVGAILTKNLQVAFCSFFVILGLSIFQYLKNKR